MGESDQHNREKWSKNKAYRFRVHQAGVQSPHARAVDTGKLSKKRASLYSSSKKALKIRDKWVADPGAVDIDEIDGAVAKAREKAKKDRSKEKTLSQSQLDKMMG